MKGSSRAASPLPMLEQRWDGGDESKERFHKDALVVLRALAEAGGLGPKDYDVSSNKMGPVSLGFVGLYTDRFHLWISGGSRASWGSSCPECREDLGHVTARRVAGRKDHLGVGANLSVEWELLWDPPSLVTVLRLEGVL
jgi:hypothetical protein